MKPWIKSLGTAKQQIPHSGLATTTWVTEDIGFPTDPSVRPGDRLVLYASGTGRIFGVVEVMLSPSLDNRAAPWSYRCPVRARLVIDELQRAPTLDAANVGSRNLRKSIQRRSHMRLESAEYDAAVLALEDAVDVDRGDIRKPSIGGAI